jgi:hypothetical protein
MTVTGSQPGQPPTQGNAPKPDGRAAAFAQPSGKSLNFGEGLGNGVGGAQEVRTEEIAPRTEVARSALEMVWRLESHGIDSLVVDLPGDGRKAPAMIDDVVPPMQENDGGPFLPLSFASIKTAVDDVIFEVRRGTRRRKRKVRTHAEFHARGLRFRGNKIRAFQKRAGRIDVWILTIQSRRARGSQKNGHPVNESAQHRIHPVSTIAHFAGKTRDGVE